MWISAEKGITLTARSESAVRRIVIDPLLGMGLRKPKSRSVVDQAEFLARLERRLGYLEEAQLGALAEVIQRAAGGDARNVWPDEVSILNWASAMEPPPDGDSRLVTSYLASAAGRRAWEEAPEVAVALRAHLRRVGRPPIGDYDWEKIRGKAVGWHRELARIARLEEEGGLLEEHRAFRTGILAAIDLVRGLVFAKAKDAH